MVSFYLLLVILIGCLPMLVDMNNASRSPEDQCPSLWQVENVVLNCGIVSHSLKVFDRGQKPQKTSFFAFHRTQVTFCGH